MSRKLRQDDSLIHKVIKEISEELNIPEKKVKYAVWYFFSWQRQAFSELRYSSYLWNYFGTFEVMKSRYEKWINKEKNKLTNNIEDKNKDNG